MKYKFVYIFFYFVFSSSIILPRIGCQNKIKFSCKNKENYISYVPEFVNFRFMPTNIKIHIYIRFLGSFEIGYQN